MAAPQPDPLEDRVKDVVHVGGLAALAIAVIGATSANALIQALVLGFAGGQPELDVEGTQALVNIFLITAPFAIAVTIVVLGLSRVEFTEPNQAVKIIAFVAVARGIGLFVGNLIYQSFYNFILVVNVEDLNAAVARVSGPWPMKVGAAIVWFVIGYYEFFGPGHFVGALVAGGFAGYAVDRLLSPGSFG